MGCETGECAKRGVGRDANGEIDIRERKTNEELRRRLGIETLRRC